MGNCIVNHRQITRLVEQFANQCYLRLRRASVRFASYAPASTTAASMIEDTNDSPSLTPGRIVELPHAVLYSTRTHNPVRQLPFTLKVCARARCNRSK